MRSFARSPFLAAWLPGCLAAWLITSSAVAQTVHYVDGSGTISGAFNSFTDLIQNGTVLAGDTVLVQGLQTTSSQPVAYSNVIGLTATQGAENFAQLVFPHGVTIRPNDAIPVYLAAAGGLNPAFLLRIEGTNPDATVVSSVSEIMFIGGMVGLSLDESSTSAGLKPVILDGLAFCRNQVGLSAIADGVTLNLEISDCVVTDNPPTLVQTASYQGQTIGLKLHAIEISGIGRVAASLNSLTTQGSFTTMAPGAFANQDTGWTEHTDQGSRLVEVFASGSSDEHQGPTAFDTSPIAEVVLEVNGGNLDGKAIVSDVGWDVGIYAATEPHSLFPQPQDYSSGYRVTVSGVPLNAFRLAAIHGTSSESGRGEVYILGQTTIQNTGEDASTSPFGYVHSGIHMYTYRGYLGLVATDTVITNNAGHCIWLHNRASILGAGDYPNGLYLRALRCKIHQNGMDGIGMSAGTETSDNGMRAAAIVGGTWDTWDNYRSIEYQGHEPGNLPRGVGAINRCAISNNGRYGVSARLKGRLEDDGDPLDPFTTAACRIANTIIWNNPSGAYFVSFEDEVTNGGSTTLLMPVVHCTIMGNGESSGFNAEISDPNTGIYSAKYEYTSGSGGLSETIITRFFGSIIQRQSSTADDFGSHLTSILDLDDPDPLAVNDNAVGIEACRINPLPTMFIMRESTLDDVTPWLWNPTPNWTSWTASQFFLSSVGPSAQLDTGVMWNTAAPSESVKDYTEHLRPSTLSQRDFGAYQKNPR